MATVNLTELAKIHDVNRNLIRRTIASGRGFPWDQTTEANGTYAFDTNKVTEWLLRNEWSYGNTSYNPHITEKIERQNSDKRKILLARGTSPEEIPDHLKPDSDLPQSIAKFKNKASNAKTEVQVALLQLELDRKRGELISRSEVINEFAPVIVTLAKGLEMMPNLIGKKFGLSDELIRAIRDYTDLLRENLMRSGKSGIMSDEYAPRPDDE